ncbi:EamA family transporter [Actinacidiphila glaucinigra]|uniref:O-acetylserine/cysteine efflux transporter n=1 Tax=Actinacidiphila glaucinigra TaxID=235986 RepID=A0A239JA97_9ACTN|nr:O-acetylserine/cysteine efflux transporter [Actinacidiphila glaucinigra]
MRPAHLALAVLVAAVWGVNFVVIEVGLGHFPPLLFCALRFLVAAVPAVFFVRRPGVAARWILAAGLVLGVAKFGLLFIGMDQGMPAGLSSLVLQVQAVFTALLAVALLGERPGRLRTAGMGVAFAGIGVAAYGEGASGPIGAFVLVVAAAAFWGLSNVLTRRAAPPDALSWMVWVSLVPPLPLLALSLVVEGPAADVAALRGLDWSGAGAIVYVAWITTVFGFGAWGFLLRTYNASTVAPFSLLVPVFGMTSAALLLDEGVGPLRWTAAVLLVGGVGLTSLGSLGSIRPGRGRGPGEGAGLRRTRRAAAAGANGPATAAPAAPAPAGTSASRTPSTASRPSPRG